MMLYWEVTRACDLACRHCRAEAIAQRDPRELSTAEGRRLLDAISRFGEPRPHLVVTGGDPLRRPDLYELIQHAVGLGLVVSVTPSGTPLATQEAMVRMKEAGVSSLAFSLDGSSAERHDAIRGITRTFDRTVSAIQGALATGLPVQVNTLAAAETVDDLPAVYRLVCDMGVQRWAVFFLIGVGRGAVLSEMSPAEAERTLEWLHELSLRPRPVLKTTEAHHFRRIAAQRKPGEDRAQTGGTRIRTSWGIRDGAGIMFISNVGDVYPSGFLPITVGNVRQDDPVQLYREAPLFRQMRDPDQLKGKCGRCEFRVICGGSRARAYAATGDPLESDPLCIYEPAERRTPVAAGSRSAPA
ncbi:MAG: TIGR04053 family radical SAM/SPASM domain-containing protein [Chloroflexi bacterium]|nr:TIGR04053 family radical SAM/SPASM domain-containing protein [Chloroflexota bacterium]